MLLLLLFLLQYFTRNSLTGEWMKDVNATVLIYFFYAYLQASINVFYLYIIP